MTILNEMPLKCVTSIQVTRTLDNEMDYENFVQYHRRLTDLHSTEMSRFLLYEMPLKCVASIQDSRQTNGL